MYKNSVFFSPSFKEHVNKSISIQNSATFCEKCMFDGKIYFWMILFHMNSSDRCGKITKNFTTRNKFH